ncbi:MAG: PilZ domain-containing protein [Gemmataceae bacterium]|nr:PilZ domain-containing protein [Gemmataceae bacterium]
MSTAYRLPQRALAQKPLGIDRRLRVRFAFNRLTFCSLVTPAGHPSWWPAMVHDISATGIGLILPQRLEPGTLLSVDLDGVCRLLLGRVVHAAPQAGGHWRIGCAFLGQLTLEELQALPWND